MLFSWRNPSVGNELNTQPESVRGTGSVAAKGIRTTSLQQDVKGIVCDNDQINLPWCVGV